MKRYFSCRRKSKVIQPEFVGGTPVEILSPLFKHCQPLPKEKDKLEALDFEIVEQIHLLEAEYNKRFQDAKHCIEKNDMVKGLHYMSRSNELKKRILELEKRHRDILDALEQILINHPSYPYSPQKIQKKSMRYFQETPPTPK